MIVNNNDEVFIQYKDGETENLSNVSRITHYDWGCVIEYDDCGAEVLYVPWRSVWIVQCF